LNSSDIKPVRSEALDNRKRRNIGGSSLLFVSLLGLLNLGGLVILGLWFFNASGYQQEAGQSFVERISFLEEEIDSMKTVNEETLGSLEEKTKFIDKEIRKLWDLSNKRNRKNIDSLTIQLQEVKGTFEEISKRNNSILAKQRARGLEIAKLEKVQANLKTKLSNLDASNESFDFNKKLQSQAEAIEAFDAYRIQMNKALIEVEEKLDKLLIKIEDSQ
tara:strand:- start:17049 stop:17702 length:654 start_codon:yes stop_codon:yes gene_type:complete